MLLWLVWRCFGRRDWLMVGASLDGTAMGIFDVYHPRRRGGLDATNEVRALFLFLDSVLTKYSA